MSQVTGVTPLRQHMPNRVSYSVESVDSARAAASSGPTVTAAIDCRQ